MAVVRHFARKECLARLVDRRLTGIVMNDHTDASGELVFQQACRMGLEGIVSQAVERALPVRPLAGLDQVNNPDSPAMERSDRADGLG
jgi:hypothetical protein